MPAPLELVWHALDADGLAARLAYLGFDVVTLRGIRVASADGVAIRVSPTNRSRDGRLELLADERLTRAKLREGERGGSRSEGVPGLLGLGWATVDIERAEREFSALRFRRAADDSALGARALVARWSPGEGQRSSNEAATAPSSSDRQPAEPRNREATALVLLEPATEGRLAARLARHGEGPAALYLAVPDGSATGRLKAIGVEVDGPSDGPFGSSVRLAGPAAAPQLLLVGGGEGGAGVRRGPIA